MTNRLVGWVNLVDAKGRIRWQAHGPAKEHEIETLLKSASAIMNEVNNGHVVRKHL